MKQVGTIVFGKSLDSTAYRLRIDEAKAVGFTIYIRDGYTELWK